VAIKVKFAKEFWMVGGADIVKTIARAKLAEVISFCSVSLLMFVAGVPVS
jgi:hypothetical protein